MRYATGYSHEELKHADFCRLFERPSRLSLKPLEFTATSYVTTVLLSSSPLGLIEGEGNKQQLLVALDLQSDGRSRWQSLERTTQTIERSHGLAIQRANHVSCVQRHFHAGARRASGNDDPKRVSQVRRHRGNLLVNLHPENPQRRHKIFLRVGQCGDLVHIARRLHHRDVEN